MAATAALSANSRTITTPSSGRLFFNSYDKGQKKRQINFLKIRASDDSECNTEECAPDKEVNSTFVFFWLGFVPDSVMEFSFVVCLDFSKKKNN